MARTAVIAGTATAVSGGVQRRGAAKHADQDAATAQQQQQLVDQAAAQAAAQMQQPSPAQAPAEDPTIARLKELGELKSQGVLTDDEFSAAKAKLLGI